MNSFKISFCIFWLILNDNSCIITNTQEGHTGEVVYENIDKILQIDGVTPHIYGKKITKPFRKMGHVTIVDKDIVKARKVAQQVKKIIKVISK